MGFVSGMAGIGLGCGARAGGLIFCCYRVGSDRAIEAGGVGFGAGWMSSE